MATAILRPNSNGYFALSTYPSGTSGYGCVNEVTSDGDSTYIYASGTLTYLPASTYTYFGLDVSALPAKININSCVVHAVARTVNSKDVGTLSMSVGIGDAPTSSSVSGLNYGAIHTLSTSYTNYNDSITPAAVAVSTETLDLNSGLFVALSTSVKKASTKGSTAYIRITQVYVELDYDEVPTVPSIASATMTPNPVDIGNTVLISVDVQEI